MMNWLREHEWVQDSQSGFSRSVSFLAFLAMPGCVLGAIIERFIWPKP